MVVITFPDSETQKTALGFLLGRFSGKVLKNGEHIVPEGALVDLAEATRPSGLPTMAQPKQVAKGRFAFSVPIEPDQGDKMTVFQIHYHLPYTG